MKPISTKHIGGEGPRFAFEVLMEINDAPPRKFFLVFDSSDGSVSSFSSEKDALLYAAAKREGKKDCRVGWLSPTIKLEKGYGFTIVFRLDGGGYVFFYIVVDRNNLNLFIDPIQQHNIDLFSFPESRSDGDSDEISYKP